MAYTEQYEVVVVGAGHAGCEAAIATAEAAESLPRGLLGAIEVGEGFEARFRDGISPESFRRLGPADAGDGQCDGCGRRGDQPDAPTYSPISWPLSW